MIVTVTAWMIGYFFTLLFLCGTHFNAYWTSPITEQTECLPTKPVHLSYAISDVITDVLTILLPIPQVFQNIYQRPAQMIDRILDLEAPHVHSPQACHYWCVRARRNVGLWIQRRWTMRAHTFNSTIAMSIIRMVIYYRALTGLPSSTCALPFSLLTCSQFNLTQTRTSNVKSKIPSSFLCTIPPLTLLHRYHHPDLILLLTRSRSRSLRRLPASPLPLRPPSSKEDP